MVQAMLTRSTLKETQLNMHPPGMLFHSADYVPFLSRSVMDLVSTEEVMVF
jgi:hypothetical protein